MRYLWRQRPGDGGSKMGLSEKRETSTSIHKLSMFQSDLQSLDILGFTTFQAISSMPVVVLGGIAKLRPNLTN